MSHIAADHFLRRTAPIDAVPRQDSTGVFARRALGAVRTEVLSLREMLLQIAPWRALSQIAAEANVFHDPAFQAAALLHLPEIAIPRFLVLRHASEGGWIGVVCLYRQTQDFGLPAWRNWHSRLSSLGAPLIHKEHVALAAAAILEWLEVNGEAAHLVLRGLRAEGPVLTALAESRPGSVVSLACSARAVLTPQTAAGNFGQSWYSGKRRSKLKRLRARLAAEGDVTFMDAGAHGRECCDRSVSRP